jgi:prefoldin beta subunit
MVEQEEKIKQLQNMEQNLQVLTTQKQTFQAQLLEVDNALGELEKTKDQVYKIIGTIMVNANKEETKKELQGRKEILELRIKNIEKQEKSLKEHADTLQKELVKNLKN